MRVGRGPPPPIRRRKPRAVKVPVARSRRHRVAFGRDARERPQATEALVDSYVRAAADLTSALEEMRDQRDLFERRLSDLRAPFRRPRFSEALPR
jgi:hypothetical protein